MAELSQRIPELSEGVRTGFSLLLILVFGIKAGLFPLFFWLPDSYPTAPGAITAVFAGLLTKVGVYAIIRSQTLLFPPEAQQGSFLLVLAGFTMVIGVLGALAQDDLRRMLSFHIVSHIGYMIFGLALFTLAGIAGAVFYVVHHIIVKTALFLVAGLVERRAGSDRLSRIGGLVRSAPMIAVLFALPALSIAGLPPFSGFVGKFALVGSGIESDEWAIVAVSLIVSLLTMYVMVRIWSGVFWGEPEDPAIASWIASDESRVPHLMTGAATAVVGTVGGADDLRWSAVRLLQAHRRGSAGTRQLRRSRDRRPRVTPSVRLPALIIWLTLVWALLWGDLGLASLLSGLGVAVFVVFIARPTGVHGIQLTSFHPVSAVVFLVYFLVQLVKSNFQVAWEVITPGSNVNRAIIAVPLHVTTDGLVTLVGNAITLTPGTLTVDVRADDPDRPPVLYVHALHFTDVESLRRDVLRLERLAVRAFGTKEQRVELDRVVAAWPQGGSQ